MPAFRAHTARHSADADASAQRSPSSHWCIGGACARPLILLPSRAASARPAPLASAPHRRLTTHLPSHLRPRPHPNTQTRQHASAPSSPRTPTHAHSAPATLNPTTATRLLAPRPAARPPPSSHYDTASRKQVERVQIDFDIAHGSTPHRRSLHSFRDASFWRPRTDANVAVRATEARRKRGDRCFIFRTHRRWPAKNA